jgi:DeoR/GlpR family transcriptional regulator of sugar metabolism
MAKKASKTSRPKKTAKKPPSVPKRPTRHQLSKMRAELRERVARCREHVTKVVVEDRQRLAIQEVVKQFGRTAQAIRNDVGRYFQHRNLPISIERDHLIHNEHRLTTEGRREFENKATKAAIGEVGALLIVGPKHDLVAKDSSMAKQLERSDDPVPMSDVLRQKLDTYMTKAHRLAIIDSGSTTLAIAKALTKHKTPAPDRHLNFLRVLTNGRRVAQALDSPESTHGIILLGGALRRDTQAVAGLLAERCLDSWLAHTSDLAIADVAIIGTTNVNANFDLFSDSEIESEMKSRLLNSARIKCICADSGKLMRRGGGSWAFCAFTPSMIDLVITDSKILEKQENLQFELARIKFLERAKENRIYVAVAH